MFVPPPLGYLEGNFRKQLALDYIIKVVLSWWGYRPELALPSQTLRENCERTAKIQPSIGCSPEPDHAGSLINTQHLRPMRKQTSAV